MGRGQTLGGRASKRIATKDIPEWVEPSSARPYRANRPSCVVPCRPPSQAGPVSSPWGKAGRQLVGSEQRNSCARQRARLILHRPDLSLSPWWGEVGEAWAKLLTPTLSFSPSREGRGSLAIPYYPISQ